MLEVSESANITKGIGIWPITGQKTGISSITLGMLENFLEVQTMFIKFQLIVGKVVRNPPVSKTNCLKTSIYMIAAGNRRLFHF